MASLIYEISTHAYNKAKYLKSPGKDKSGNSYTLGNPNFNTEALKDLTTTELIIIVGVGVVTVTVLYFAANDTLVSILDSINLGEKTIGDLLVIPFTYILVAPLGTLTHTLSNQPELTDNE